MDVIMEEMIQILLGKLSKIFHIKRLKTIQTKLIWIKKNQVLKKWSYLNNN